MMKCLPQVTTVGLPTRGSSGNPKPFKLPGVPVTVIYSVLGGYAPRRHAGRRPRRRSRDPGRPARSIVPDCRPDLGTDPGGPEGKSQSDTETRNIDMVTHRSTAAAHFEQGVALLRAGRHDAAEISFRQALTVDPMLATAWVGVSQVQAERGEIERSSESAVRPWP